MFSLIASLTRKLRRVSYARIANEENIENSTTGEYDIETRKQSRIRQISLRYKPLALPLVIWVVLFVFFQQVEPWFMALRCNFIAPPESNEYRPYNILLVADPQLIDNHTYPDYNSLVLSLSKFTVDNYIYKNYWRLVGHLSPDAVVFLGDLLDNGRESSDEYYEHELARFNKLFQPQTLRKDGMEVFLNVPGNHDIGFGNGVLKHSVGRFERDFGVPNQNFIREEHELVFLDTISLSNKNDASIGARARSFVDELVAEKNSHHPRILFDHVPVYRDGSKQTCGKQREVGTFIKPAAGYQYQDLIDPDLSKAVLESVQPQIIFSGDDHDYCEVIHEYDTQDADGSHVTKHAIEINVKSISMAMGIRRPAVELLSLYNKAVPGKVLQVNGKPIDDIPYTFSYKMCYLPLPYTDIMFYGIFAFFNFLFLVYSCVPRPRYTGFAIDEVYTEPKLLDRIKGLRVRYLAELCAVECLALWAIYCGVFTIHYY